MKSGIVESVSVAAGGRVLEFRRRLNSRPQRVWGALTDPEKLRQWYAQTEDYPVVGQPYQLFFENSNTTVQTSVTRARRPSILEYTWDSQTPESSPVSLVGSVVRFELEPFEDGSLLAINHIFQTDEIPVADVLGGWHIHLDELASRLHNGFEQGEVSLSRSFLDDCAIASAAFAQSLNVGFSSQGRLSQLAASGDEKAARFSQQNGGTSESFEAAGEGEAETETEYAGAGGGRSGGQRATGGRRATTEPLERGSGKR